MDRLPAAGAPPAEAAVGMGMGGSCLSWVT
jgi:hypothetical protein